MISLRAIATWPKVHSGVEALYRTTFQVAQASSICSKQNHLITQVRPEQRRQVTQVVVVTSEVTAVLILHLSVTSKERRYSS